MRDADSPDSGPRARMLNSKNNGLDEALDDDGLSGMWKARALKYQAAIEKLESYCFGLETQARGFRPKVIRELFADCARSHKQENDRG